MAAQRFALVYSPDKPVEVKKDVTIIADLLDPGVDQIYVGFGTDVRTGRGNEIVNAMRWLVNGAKDRLLLDRPSPDFLDDALVTAVSIDVITTQNRRTASTVAAATVAGSDIVIAMGTNTTNYARVMVDNVFEQLIRAVQEWLYKNG